MCLNEESRGSSCSYNNSSSNNKKKQEHSYALFSTLEMSRQKALVWNLLGNVLFKIILNWLMLTPSLLQFFVYTVLAMEILNTRNRWQKQQKKRAQFLTKLNSYIENKFLYSSRCVCDCKRINFSFVFKYSRKLIFRFLRYL